MSKRRLAVYFHYDPQGQVDTACRIAVDAMRHHTEKIWFVTNGTLTSAARAWVMQSGAALLERENIGFDVGAYRQALFAIGRDKLAGYDELLLMNYTLAGPVCSLDAMFAAMEARPELAFWGLSRHYAMRSRRFGGQVPEHLQSHFLAVRSALLRSDVFWAYWQQMKLPQSYEQAVVCHELRFTAHFAALGHKWDSYLKTDDLREVFVNPLMACPRELVAERGCPFFKRRSFFTDYADELRRTDGSAARQLYDHLKKETGYPVDLLVTSLLRTQPLRALAENLHWHTVFPEQSGTSEQPALESLGLAVIRLDWPVTGDAVTDYYLEKNKRQADPLLPQAAELFRQEPTLGLAGPVLPSWPGAQRAAAQRWQADFDAVRRRFPSLPLDPHRPPPLPYSGWLLVNLAALGGELPPLESPADYWMLPLLAQQNGFGCRTFESEAQAAARADILRVRTAQAQDPAAVAHRLASLAKQKMRGGTAY